MTGEITIGLRDVIAIIIGLGGPGAVYVAMRERMVRQETKIEALTDVIKELRDTIKDHGTARASHAEDIGEVRETLADHAARLHALEHPRTSTGSYQALGAEQTGPHKTHPER